MKLRVPRENNSLLCVPAMTDWRAHLQRNRDAFASCAIEIGGLPLQRLRRLAREELAQRALDAPAYENPDPDCPWIVTGHQPELFHPGVWIKSFAAAGLAKGAGGAGVHILIDNDALKTTKVRVPSGGPDAPLVAHVPFDAWQGEVPFEERNVVDPERFRCFGDEVARRLAPYGVEPLARRMWKEHDEVDRTTNLGEALSEARRGLERQWGCVNAETALSQLAQSGSFRRLCADIMLSAEAFHAVYNEAIASFRRKNKIRSRTHPVPALESVSGYTEVPLWTWTPGETNRRRAFVRVADRRLVFKAGDVEVGEITADAADPIGSIADQLPDVLGDWKLRPRALLTTLFLRLCIADLFVHGVGGGKYDELTDRIIEKFWRIQAPLYAVLSATVYWPPGVKPPDPSPLEKVKRQQRDSCWNPDRYLDPVLRDQEPIAGWIERKFELMADEGSSRVQRRKRYREFRSINEKLRKYLGHLPEQLENQRARAESDYFSQSLLHSREFAYCLYPENALRPLFEKTMDEAALR